MIIDGELKKKKKKGKKDSQEWNSIWRTFSNDLPSIMGNIRAGWEGWQREKCELQTGEPRGSVTSWSECHLYRAMRYTLLAAMTAPPSLSAIVYFLDRDLAVMYGCGFARYTSHIRPSIRYRAITRTRCHLSEKRIAGLLSALDALMRKNRVSQHQRNLRAVVSSFLIFLVFTTDENQRNE